jgi:hypothetical protein
MMELFGCSVLVKANRGNALRIVSEAIKHIISRL